MLILALKGIAAGALCSLPFGPAGMLCVHRTLTAGERAGMASAMGIVVAHALWCGVAIGHWEVLGAGLAAWERPLEAGLGVLLLALGLRAWRLARGRGAKLDRPGRADRGFAPTLVLVGLNPATLLTVAAAIWWVGLNPGHGGAGNWGVAAAVFAGGALLWLALARACSRWGAGANEVTLARVQHALAVLLTGLGTVKLASAAARLL